MKFCFSKCTQRIVHFVACIPWVQLKVVLVQQTEEPTSFTHRDPNHSQAVTKHISPRVKTRVIHAFVSFSSPKPFSYLRPILQNYWLDSKIFAIRCALVSSTQGAYTCPIIIGIISSIKMESTIFLQATDAFLFSFMYQYFFGQPRGFYF